MSASVQVEWRRVVAGTRCEELALKARDAIAAVHRRPAALRKPEIAGAESVLRGARLSALIEQRAGSDLAEESSVAVSALLAPGTLEGSARMLSRAPLNIFARMDVAAGGDGVPPSEEAACRLQALSQLLIDAPGDWLAESLLPQFLHAEVLRHQLFGPRSGVIARALCRLAAVQTGFDPRGLAVPETYLYRNFAEYRDALDQGSVQVIEVLLRAWESGAAEAEGILKNC